MLIFVVSRQEILKHSPNNRFRYLRSFLQVVYHYIRTVYRFIRMVYKCTTFIFGIPVDSFGIPVDGPIFFGIPVEWSKMVYPLLLPGDGSGITFSEWYTIFQNGIPFSEMVYHFMFAGGEIFPKWNTQYNGKHKNYGAWWFQKKSPAAQSLR